MPIAMRVKPYFEVIRYHCDKLERLVDDQLWPLTKYRELLFVKVMPFSVRENLKAHNLWAFFN